jgi:P2 family phage contractile tail tube protein
MTMPNPVMVMDYANLFCGAGPADDRASNHLVLTEVNLPAMDVQYADHRAAGAPIYIEVDTGMARLECTFVLIGITPQVMSLVDSWITEQRKFFVYGNVRDQMTGVAWQAAAAFRGQLGRADPQNFRKGDVMHTNYSIREITHYELGLGGNLVYYWDFFENIRYVGGQDFNSEINSNLNIAVPAPELLLTNFQIGMDMQPTTEAPVG